MCRIKVGICITKNITMVMVPNSVVMMPNSMVMMPNAVVMVPNSAAVMSNPVVVTVVSSVPSSSSSSSWHAGERAHTEPPSCWTNSATVYITVYMYLSLEQLVS